MTKSYLWATYAQLQDISRFAPTTPWGRGLDEALDFIIGHIEANTTCTAQQIANVIINRAAKHRRRAMIDGDIARGLPDDDRSIELRDEIVRRLSRCSSRETAIIVEIGEGKTVAEIAVTRGVPEGTIKTWTRRARMKAAA